MTTPAGTTAALALVTLYPDVPPRTALAQLLAQHEGRVLGVAGALQRGERPVHPGGVRALAEAIGVVLPCVKPGSRRAFRKTTGEG